MPDDERPIGELVSDLIEDGKAYARAEANVYKTMATSKAKRLVLPAALLLGAFMVLQAAINALAVAVFVLLVPALGPILAGILALVVFAGAAAGLAWFGVSRAREVLK